MKSRLRKEIEDLMSNGSCPLAGLGKKDDSSSAIELPAPGDGFDGTGSSSGTVLVADNGLIRCRMAHAIDQRLAKLRTQTRQKVPHPLSIPFVEADHRGPWPHPRRVGGGPLVLRYA